MQPTMTHDDGDMIRRRYNNATDDGGGGSINCNNGSIDGIAASVTTHDFNLHC